MVKSSFYYDYDEALMEHHIFLFDVNICHGLVFIL